MQNASSRRRRTPLLFPHLFLFIVRYYNLYTTKNDLENQRGDAILGINEHVCRLFQLGYTGYATLSDMKLVEW